MMRGTFRWCISNSLLGAVALVCVTSVAQAQASQPTTMPLVPGTRVRVTSSGLIVPLVANFLQMRGDTAVFIEDAAGRGIWSLPIGDISKIELSQGERRQNRSPIIRGAMIGGGSGAAAAWIFSRAAQPSDPTKRYNVALNIGAGALVGALIGGAIGSRFRDENWTNLPLPKRLTLVPAGHGVGLRVGFDF
jgi:hypothetical protein